MIHVMNELLKRFEDKCGLAPPNAHRLLGVSYSTYAAYRNQSRPVPAYIQNSVEVHMLLDNAELDSRVKQLLSDDQA